MKLGRLAFNTHHVLRSTFSLGMVTLVALYAGGSVPDEFRRYIVTPQDTTSAELEAAANSTSNESWKTVGSYVVDADLLSAMRPAERALIKAAYQQEVKQAKTEAMIRQSIRVPLLPGPVVAANIGPSERIDPPNAALPAPAITPVAAKTAPAPTAEDDKQKTATAEDLATIEALKIALQDLKKEGVSASSYRNDTAD